MYMTFTPLKIILQFPLTPPDAPSHSLQPWDFWQPFELTDNYSEPSEDDTIGMGWTARYAKKDTEIDLSDFTEDFTDDEEYDTRLPDQS